MLFLAFVCPCVFDTCLLVLDEVAMFVAELCEQEAAKAEDSDGVALGVVAALDAVTVHVAQRLSEAHAQASPTFAFTSA